MEFDERFDDESFIIPADKLRSYIDKAEETRLRLYNINLKKCFQRIKIANVAQKTNCYYEIPDIILGEPSYDKEKCLHYLILRLEKSGYRVRRRKKRNFAIKISWGIHESKEQIISKVYKRIEDKKNQPVPIPIQHHQPQKIFANYPFYNLAAREEIIKNLNNN